MKHGLEILCGRICMLLLAGLIAVGEAHAAGCTISSSGMAFGVYQPLNLPGKLRSEAATSSAVVSVSCSGIVDPSGGYTITLGPSLFGSGDRISTRYLTSPSGGDAMAYNVYREPPFFNVWGDGVVAGGVLQGVVLVGDSIQSQTVYGYIPAGQSTLLPGNYSGTLTMTLSFQP